jgi:bifunctional non-homologous end joining protein LigD
MPQRALGGVKLAMPADLSPMLAVPGELPPEDERWTYEYKWDGVRALCYWDGRRLKLQSRNSLDMTVQYPELQALGPALGKGRRCILDGEVVALDDLDRPSFSKLQKRMKVTHAPTALALSRENPVWLMLFDVLWVDGAFVTRKPLLERREVLEELVEGPSWQVSPIYRRNGAELLEAARANEVEGIVAKRVDSPYEPGVRSSSWRKVKIVLRQEFVIGGWTVEKGANAAGNVGALQVGYYDCDGQLRYAGAVGSGFTHATLADLAKRFAAIKTDASPFADRLPKRDVRWVRPELLAEIEFRRWPAGGMLQQAAYKGLRFDKNPREVIKEYQACIPRKRGGER